MKRKILISLFFVLLMLLSSCGEEATVKEEGKEQSTVTEQEQKEASKDKGDIISFSSFSAADLNGTKVNEGIFEGKKLTMINVWATFCSPCLSEMPSLGKLHTAYGDDFQVIGIVTDTVDSKFMPIDSQVKKARSIAAQTGADYMHLVPTADLQSIHISSIMAVPETIFVDENGDQVGEVYVGSKDESQWAAIIEGLLEELK